MRDGEEEDSGVLVGGDAYGSVQVTPRRERRSVRGARSRRRGLIASGLLSCVVLGTSGVTWGLTTYAEERIQGVDAGVSGPGPTGAMNILLVGVDRRDNLSRRQQNELKLGRESGQRTDTMMVIHLSKDHRKVTVVSLPRDTWTTIPGKGEHKINAAYQLGGAKLAVRAVQNVTGLTINHYVEVNVLGFIHVVDALGGISVCTPVPINDPKTALDLQPGTYSLDGVKALAYARTRATARSDLDRIDRQQQVISALLSQALSGDTLTNPVKLASFVDTTLGTLRVDDPLRKDLLGLAGQLKDVSTDDVSFATVPIADVDYKTPTGESAVLWDKKAAAELFRRIDADETLVAPASSSPKPGPAASSSASPKPPAPTVPPSRISLRVLNGTTIAGLGARARTDLQKVGFLVPDAAGDTPQKDFTKTVVRHGPGREDSARTVAAALPGAELRPVDSLGDGIEVVVGSGYTPAKKVTVKEPAAASPSATPSATPTARTATQNICKK
ncbi:LCP family protein required for cell wall assembly [Streptosporangium becharense]|uniref:LCP family protein required for cell wall assembly n=1 Tax=Streptosporangium becharense TaxID=1816182 RepID=A0A7W9IF48_9ACTN|nr:LCP family protein [Streptosporangium becharense]MBB2909668.1 LCP family protein required for cell wall assembly [Streptosporangium becharense]MBB5819376.1 LCP family protein required for cell wall assembly [Streptosporangium becharense]